jgi:hypothetical protein
MHYFGIIATSFGVVFLVQAFLHRRRLNTKQQPPIVKNDLKQFARSFTPLFIFLLLGTALVLAAIALRMDTQNVLSIVDIAGFLFFVGAYSLATLIRSYDALKK